MMNIAWSIWGWWCKKSISRGLDGEHTSGLVAISYSADEADYTEGDNDETNAKSDDDKNSNGKNSVNNYYCLLVSTSVY